MPKVTAIEIAQGAKGNYKKLTVEGQSKSVNVFPFHSLYAEIEAGSEVELEQNGQWMNVVDPAKQDKPAGARTAVIEKAQARKEASIGAAMDKKSDAIALSGSARDATLIMTTFYSDLVDEVTDEEIKKKWQEWRQWFLKEYTKDIDDVVTPF